MKKLAVVLISVVTALTGATPAEAFPAVNLDKPKVVSNIEQVQDRAMEWSAAMSDLRSRPKL